MKQRMIKAGVLLLVLMIMFTIISRMAYNMSIAEVSTQKPEAQTFIPDVSAQGIVTGRQEIAVSAVESLRVGVVHVVEGQTVEAGAVLFELDMQDLTKKMQEKQQELHSLDLQIQSAEESAALTAESRQLTLSQLQEDYNRTAVRENAAVDTALSALRQAQEKYQNFISDREVYSGEMNSDQEDLGQSDSSQPDPGQTNSMQSGSIKEDFRQTAEELLAVVQEKQTAYDQAIQSREDSLYQVQKAMDTANLGTAKDYSVEQVQITRGQKEQEIAELQRLIDVQGKVTAPSKGMVTGVMVKPGSLTTGGGDILLADISCGASLSVTFPREMRKYVQVGFPAVVTAENFQQGQQVVMEQVTIQTVADGSMYGNGAADTRAGAASELALEGSFTVTVALPPDHFMAGETAGLKVEVPASDYAFCVPIGALHLMSGEQYYVNVAEKRATVLGEEWVVRQVNVELLERNEKYAAVEGISFKQEVVIESSRTLENGSRVKVKNETG